MMGNSYAVREKAKSGGLVWATAMVICDVSIAGALIWKSRSMKSSFAHTNTFIHRVMVSAIQTGSTTSLASILLLITFLHDPQSNIPTLFIYLFAPLYCLTLLFNLNIRRNASNAGTSKTSESRGGNNNNIIMDGIQVHRTAVVTMDPTDSDLDAARRRTDEDNSIKKDLDVESFGARKVKVTTLG
ncbi:hypothetical protein C8J57DRAFT_224334 [Mycena rebaudengoi]|nr:hypothetical protein C8J57DRAFT_224334 [Mycena rebaudengoi]